MTPTFAESSSLSTDYRPVQPNHAMLEIGQLLQESDILREIVRRGHGSGARVGFGLWATPALVASGENRSGA